MKLMFNKIMIYYEKVVKTTNGTGFYQYLSQYKNGGKLIKRQNNGIQRKFN